MFKAGDKTSQICIRCRGIVPVTMKPADFNVGNIDGVDLILTDILQGFCDKCGDFVFIPEAGRSDIEIKKEVAAMSRAAIENAPKELVDDQSEVIGDMAVEAMLASEPGERAEDPNV